MRNHHSFRLQLLFRTLFTVGLVTLLMIDAFVLQNNKEGDKTKEITTAVNMKNSDTKDIQQELEDGSGNGDLSYVAGKRKVPRGPDPIHNRFLLISCFIFHFQEIITPTYMCLACFCMIFHYNNIWPKPVCGNIHIHINFFFV